MAYKLSNLIRARFPMIYIATFEEDRVTKYIKSVVTDEKQVKGAKDFLSIFEPISYEKAIEFIYTER